VTEAITGIDLVEWQLRVAAGERLPLAQEDLAIRGHAFEARLCAEDVAAGFLPATGRIAHLAFPGGVRVETGVRAGDAVSPWYDPMIAKIVVHGPTRAVALQRLARALEQTEVAGTVTNLAFLAALARHPGLAAGDVDTGLIERDAAALAAPRPARPAATVAAALAAAGLWQGAPADAGFALWAPLARPVVLGADGATLEAVLTVEGPDLVRVALAGVEHRAERRAGGWWIDGAKGPARVVATGAEVHVFDPEGGGAAAFTLPDPLARQAAAGMAEDVVRAPMPGLVRQVFVTAGEVVAAGARLAVLEAMKMEHVLAAAAAGRVAEVLVAPGTQVEAGATLVRMEPSAP
jgi:3-methylcrotonyl-CoA carboxylase alpha subunit